MLWSPNSLHYTNSPHTHHILHLILYTNYEPIASTCQIFSFFTPHLSLLRAPTSSPLPPSYPLRPPCSLPTAAASGGGPHGPPPPSRRQIWRVGHPLQ